MKLSVMSRLIASVAVLFAPLAWCKADFLAQPPIAKGGVLQTPNANSFVSGPMIKSITANGDFTIEGWVFIPKQTATSGLPGFLFFQEGLAVVEIRESTFGSVAEIFFGVATGEAKQFEGPAFTEFWTLLQDAWHHIACVYDSKNRDKRIYLDGIITVPGIKQITTFGIYPSVLDRIRVGGNREDLDRAWGFFWDEVRISKGIRYDANFAPPRDPFSPDTATLALWHFDEPGAATISDASGGGHTLSLANGARVAALSSVPTPPRLTITRKDATVIISWAATSGSFILESNATLSGANSWAAVPGDTVTSDGQTSITEPLTLSSTFFRLKSQ